MAKEPTKESSLLSENIFETDGASAASTLANSTESSYSGRVKIIGALGGNKLYASAYALDPSSNIGIMATEFNTLRKNVSLATRQMPTDGAKVIQGIRYIAGKS